MSYAIRRRRRVARLLAAGHLLRCGSVIYGVHFRDRVSVGPERPLLVSQCYFDGTDVKRRRTMPSEPITRSDLSRKLIAAAEHCADMGSNAVDVHDINLLSEAAQGFVAAYERLARLDLDS